MGCNFLLVSFFLRLRHQPLAVMFPRIGSIFLPPLLLRRSYAVPEPTSRWRWRSDARWPVIGSIGNQPLAVPHIVANRQ